LAAAGDIDCAVCNVLYCSIAPGSVGSFGPRPRACFGAFAEDTAPGFFAVRGVFVCRTGGGLAVGVSEACGADAVSLADDCDISAGGSGFGGRSGTGLLGDRGSDASAGSSGGADGSAGDEGASAGEGSEILAAGIAGPGSFVGGLGSIKISGIVCGAGGSGMAGGLLPSHATNASVAAWLVNDKTRARRNIVKLPTHHFRRGFPRLRCITLPRAGYPDRPDNTASTQELA